MIILVLLFLFGFHQVANAAELSDADLLLKAKTELTIPSASKGTGATVSTIGVVPESMTGNDHSAQEFSLGAQRFRPMGTGVVSSTESYSLDSINSHWIGVLGVDRWWNSLNPDERGYRFGLGFSLGLGRQGMNLVSNTGTHYDGVSLTYILPTLGPIAEYYWPKGAGLALGLSAALGRQFLVQSTSAPIANQTLQANFFQGGPYFRMFFNRQIFGRLEYLYRTNWGHSDLGIQKSNLLLSLGFGF